MKNTIPDKLKFLISQIITSPCSIIVERGADALCDFWIDVYTDKKSFCVHFVADDNIGIAFNPENSLYGEGMNHVATSVEEIIEIINKRYTD